MLADEAKREVFRENLKKVEEGNAFYQYLVGSLYAYPQPGFGVITDGGKAYEWLSKSANQGFGDGQLGLGLLYYAGDFVQRDKVKAYEWFLLARSNGLLTQGSEQIVEEAIEAIESVLSNEQKAEARKRAKELQKKIEAKKAKKEAEEKKEAKTEEDK